MPIHGSCHCQNIQYEFSPGKTPGELSFRQCGCSFCSRVGAVYTSDPTGTLQIHIDDPEQVETYHFASGVVDFVFCRRCGIMPFASIEIDGRPYAVINARTADIDLQQVDIAKLAVSEESPEEGMERRRRNWTPVV